MVYIIRIGKVGKVGRWSNIYMLSPNFKTEANEYPLFKKINVDLSLKLFNSQYKKPKLKLVEDVSHAIVFTSFISFIAVIILGITLMVDNLPPNELFMINIRFFNNISSLIVFYLLGIIILTTMLILKRTYLLVSSTFELKKE